MYIWVRSFYRDKHTSMSQVLRQLQHGNYHDQYPNDTQLPLALYLESRQTLQIDPVDQTRFYIDLEPSISPLVLLGGP